MTEELDPKRLENLFLVGVDEISYRKHHNYLTLVTNHDTGKIVYGAEGKSASSLNGFFDELGPDRAAKITAATMDMGPAFAKAFADHAPGARICLDPFHVVKLGTQALEEVSKDLWRAYETKESLRAVFAGDLTNYELSELLERWCSRASRSRIQSFVKLSKTIRTHKQGIMAAIELGVSNGRVEGLNTKIRSIVARYAMGNIALKRLWR